MLHLQAGAVPCSKSNLPVVVFGAIVKAEGAGHFVMRVRPVECRDGIHAAREEYKCSCHVPVWRRLRARQAGAARFPLELLALLRINLHLSWDFPHHKHLMLGTADIRVLIVDDHFFTRMGVAASLSLEKDIGVVAQAASGSEALDLFDRHRPDVAVIDGQLPDMHGTDVARELFKRFDSPRLLLFSIEDTEEDIHRAVSAGVSGYLSKSSRRTELVNAVRHVAAGRRFFPDRIMGKLRERARHNTLSGREMEVLRLLARGLQNKEIAAQMKVSGETVKTYVTRILEKLEVQDRTHAVMVALQRGLIKVSEATS